MLPTVLLPYQQRWLGDPARVRVIEKSRRIGISWASAAEAVIDAASVGGQDCWYVGYNKEMAVEFIRDCAWWAKKFDILAQQIGEGIFEDDEPDKRILTYSITFATGFRITALSSRPTNLRNKKGHIIIDEAAHHDDLEGLLTSAMAVLMWPGKSRVDIMSTHYGVDNPFNKLVEEVRAKRQYSLHRVTFDDALEQGLYRRMCLVGDTQWTPEAEAEYKRWVMSIARNVDEELNCVPARSGGAYLRLDVVERQMQPGMVLRLNPEHGFVKWKKEVATAYLDGWLKEHVLPLLEAQQTEHTGKLHFFGQDFGRVADRSVLVPGYLDQDLTRRVPFVIEMLDVPFESQRQVLFYVVDRLPRFSKGALDATGNGGYLAEVAFQKYGERLIERVSMTDKWYAEALPPFKAALEDKKLELVSDADHLLDLAALKVINGLPKLPKAKTESTTGPARHGDAAIGYALFYYASTLPFPEYDYTPAPRPQPTLPRRENYKVAPTEMPPSPYTKVPRGGMF